MTGNEGVRLRVTVATSVWTMEITLYQTETVLKTCVPFIPIWEICINDLTAIEAHTLSKLIVKVIM